MRIDTAFVSQTSLRNIWQIEPMIQFVKNGGYWTKDVLVDFARKTGNPCCGLIQFHRLDDGVVFLHDGHHRMVATFLGGRENLVKDEYVIKDWPYHDPVGKTGYLDISHENGWYTPFDPRTHLRTADIKKFKEVARDKFNQNPEEAIKWIYSNCSQFRIPVTNIRIVSDLANVLFPKVGVS